MAEQLLYTFLILIIPTMLLHINTLEMGGNVKCFFEILANICIYGAVISAIWLVWS